MRIRAPRDFWAGLFFIAVAAAFMLLSTQYSMGNMHRMGPALFPTLVGALLAGLGLIITARSFAIDGPPVPRLQARPILISIVAIALFGVVLAHFGLVAVAAVASSESKPLEVAGLIVVLIAFSVGVFAWLLGLPIPLWPEM